MAYRIAAILCLIVHAVAPPCAAACATRRAMARGEAAACPTRSASEQPKRQCCCRPAGRTCKAPCRPEAPKPKMSRTRCCEVCVCPFAKEPLGPVVPPENPRVQSVPWALMPADLAWGEPDPECCSQRVHGGLDPPCVAQSHNDRLAHFAVWLK